MTIAILAACVLFLIPLGSAAQENLEPEHGVYSVRDSRHQDRMREVFAEGYRYEVLFKAIILDSSSTESLIAVRESPDGFETLHLSASTRIWTPDLLSKKDGLTQRGDAIQVKVTRRSIDKRTVDGIKTIWKRMLMETRYAEPGRFGKDGIYYMFSMKDPDRGMVSGQIWSPQANSRTGHLSHLAESLVRYTHQKLTATELDRVANEARQLLAP
jgi:hypothetical protein